MSTRTSSHRPIRRAACLSLPLFLLAAGGVQAQPLTEGATSTEAEGTPERGAGARARNPSATEIIRELAPFADGNPGAPALTVRPGDGGPPVRMNTSRAVDLTVFFPYDSARLTPEARIQLEPLGQALASAQLGRHRFLVSGHTDAAGEPGYNRRLSLARARAVKAHLVEAHGIDPSRLRVHGWGATRLKRTDDPLAGVNRRVEVALIAPEQAAFEVPWVPVGGRLVRAACGPLLDPRTRVPLDLDDFGASPTPVPCFD
jgi:OOP family OmpA-OmpF porin